MVVVMQASNWEWLRHAAVLSAGGMAVRLAACVECLRANRRLCHCAVGAAVNEKPLCVGCVRGRLRKWLELATIPTMTILLIRKNELEGYERGQNGPSWGFGKPKRGLIQRSSRPMVGTVDNSNHF